MYQSNVPQFFFFNLYLSDGLVEWIKLSKFTLPEETGERGKVCSLVILVPFEIADVYGEIGGFIWKALVIGDWGWLNLQLGGCKYSLSFSKLL